MLNGKVAIVTGAGRGIGRAIVETLARRGAKVVVNDLGTSAQGEGTSSSVADEVAEAIRQDGGEVAPNHDSVTDMTGAAGIVQTALDNFGRVDILVNNAGVVRDRMVFNMTEEEWDIVISTHLKGSFACTRAIAPHFKEQRSGRIINITSTSGLIGNFGQSNYAAAKMGIVGLTKVSALDLSRYNVAVNCIAPFAWTRLIGTIPTDDPEQQERVAKMKQLSPDHVANFIAFLAEDGAQEITGQIFAVRGKEVVLMSQPRPIRSIYSPDGWTPEKLSEVLPNAFKRDMYPLHVTTDVFNYDPLV